MTNEEKARSIVYQMIEDCRKSLYNDVDEVFLSGDPINKITKALNEAESFWRKEAEDLAKDIRFIANIPPNDIKYNYRHSAHQALFAHQRRTKDKI